MEKKLSAKDFLRSIFANGGRYTMEQLLNGGMYKEVTMRTAITDLKNPKYSGGPVLFIENDGKFFFTREQSGSAPVEPETTEEDAVEEDEVSLADQIPDDMPIAKGLAAWIEDGAGLVLGAFNASFEINDEKDKFTASIELDGTPSTFTEGGRRMSISSGDGEAVVQVENEDDGRSVRLFIEAIEHGFAHAFCYPAISISKEKHASALELANEVNKRSRVAHVYLVEAEESIILCVKASSSSSGEQVAFESISYAVLETTYRYWSNFQSLSDGDEVTSTTTDNNDDVTSQKFITIETIKGFLDQAVMDYSVDGETSIYVKSGLEVNSWVSLMQNNSVLKINTYLRFREGENVDEDLALKLANRISYGYFPNAVCVNNGKLWSFYYESLEDGISKAKFINLLRRCSSSFIAAVREEDTDDIID